MEVKEVVNMKALIIVRKDTAKQYRLIRRILRDNGHLKPTRIKGGQK